MTDVGISAATAAIVALLCLVAATRSLWSP